VRIGINTRFLLTSKMEGFGWYTFEIASRIAVNHPEHEFIFFFDRPFDSKFVFSKNVIPVVVSPPARHPFIYIYWYEVALKRAMKKYKVDMLFSPDGYLSLRSSIPQIAVIHDINFEHFPKDIPWINRIYLTYFFPRFAKKAAKIITVSNYSKQDISNQYGIEKEKIRVIWNGAAPHFKPISAQLIQSVRNEITAGKPYFLFVGSLHPRKNVNRLIEAFVKFKTRTHSDIQLIIVGDYLWNKRSYTISMPKKYESDILFTGHLNADRLAEVVGSAFALTYVPYFEGFGIPLVEAMQCGVPILSGDRTSLPEVAGDAAIYCNPFDAEDIAVKMEDLANKESLRKSLSERAIERSKQFNWDIAAQHCWEEIEQILNKKRY
jgi:glycosyltransferase involved in cell wall biosynthesis